MKQRVLILAIGWEQVPLIDRLSSRKDVELYAAHYSEDYYQGADYKEVIICDMLDFSSILEFARRIQPTAVVSDQDDYAYLAQAQVAAEFRLFGPSLPVAELSTNKFLQRERCREMGLKIPNYKAVKGEEEIQDFADQYGFPVIVKPVDSRGSFGVSKVNCEKEIGEAYSEAMCNSVSGIAIVEQFIVGQEITVDGYCFKEGPKSLSLASKSKLGGDLQVAIDIEYPGLVPEVVYKKAMEVNESVCKSLGFSFGMTHAEYLIDEYDDIYLVEAANRGGGCFTSEVIVPHVCGLDLVSELTENIFGRSKISNNTVEIESNPVILKFFTFAPGIIKSLDGISALASDPQVLKYRIDLKQGDVISDVTNDGDRHGFVIVSDPYDARSKADKSIGLIDVKYE